MQQVHVFLLAGQSNMGGRYTKMANVVTNVTSRANANTLPEALQSPFSSVHMSWLNDFHFGPGDASEGWTTLRPQKSPGLGYEHFGPEITMARKLVEGIPDAKIVFIKMGLGSTNLHTNWNPKNSDENGYFPKFVEHYKNSMSTLSQYLKNAEGQNLSENFSVKVKGLFWMQGESDAGGNAKVVNGFKDNLKELINSMRILTGEPELPVVMGKINWTKAKKQKDVNLAIENVAKEGKNITWVPTDDFTKLPDDHFDGPAQQILGERMAAAYLKLVGSL